MFDTRLCMANMNDIDFIHDLDRTKDFFKTPESKNVNLDELLLYAVEFGRYDVAKFLLEKGANPNVESLENIPGWTDYPLLQVLYKNFTYHTDEDRLSLIKELLKAGANPNIVGTGGKSVNQLLQSYKPFITDKMVEKIKTLIKMHTSSLQDMARETIPIENLLKYPHLNIYKTPKDKEKFLHYICDNLETADVKDLKNFIHYTGELYDIDTAQFSIQDVQLLCKTFIKNNDK